MNFPTFPHILLLACAICPVSANEEPLNARGQALQEKYGKQLESLRTEAIAALPALDEAKKARFMELRAKLSATTGVTEDTKPDEKKALEEAREELDAATDTLAGDLIAELSPLLASDKLDPKLMRIAILSRGTPGGLAAFAQQGKDKEMLLDQLFADEALMKDMLVAGGANDGRYGEAMQIYTAIQKACERSREPGSIFQRLALGTSLEMEVGIRGREVERYQHYEKAYLDGELDPAFKDMTAWECRFITNGNRSNEDLVWMRRMMRTFRPDHITNPDYTWRYTRIVKSDFPYASIRKDPALGTACQQAIALGGSCGPRAWFGRLAARAFGIPSRKHPQTGHGAMSHWTPTGWVVNFGAWWSHSPGGLSFYLDSRVREFPEDYLKVLRAEWIGDALAEENVSLMNYGCGGGFWKGLAYHFKEKIVADAALEKSEEEKALAAMSADEAKTLLGESDFILLDKEEEKGLGVPEEFRVIELAKDGTITIPAPACFSPRKSSGRILAMKSWDDGYQLHYGRLGSRPEIFRYRIEVPAAGEYELSARVATVSADLQMLVRTNHDEPVPIDIPYTKGMWETSKPVLLKLSEGSNTIGITARAPNRGVSIKSWQLKPVK